MQKRHDIVNLFWTGGWDSTYRLLQLLIIHEKIVQPYYLIDSDRFSTGVEILTIKKIKKLLFERHARTEALLLPTKFKEVFDIPKNHELTMNYKRIFKQNYLGSQYEWLARFCNAIGSKDFELSIHRDDKAYQVLEQFVITSIDETHEYYRLNDTFQGTDEYELFKFFHFPIFNLTKLDIQDAARKEGFMDFMDLTWFCHSPRPNLRPCGVCNPCIYTIEEGLGRRIPLSSRIKYYCIQFFSSAKSLFQIGPIAKKVLRKWPAFYNFLRNLKMRKF